MRAEANDPQQRDEGEPIYESERVAVQTSRHHGFVEQVIDDDVGAPSMASTRSPRMEAVVAEA